VARSRMPSSEGQVVAANNSGSLGRELVWSNCPPTSIGSGLPLSCDSSCQWAMKETAKAHVNLGRRRQTIQRERQPLKPVAAELSDASVVPSNRRRQRTESSLSDVSCPSSAGTDISALKSNCGER